MGKKSKIEHVKYNNPVLRDSIFDCLIDYGRTIINIKKYRKYGKSKLIQMIEGFSNGRYLLTNVQIEKKLCPLDKQGSRNKQITDEDYLVIVTAKVTELERNEDSIYE